MFGLLILYSLLWLEAMLVLLILCHLLWPEVMLDLLILQSIVIRNHFWLTHPVWSIVMGSQYRAQGGSLKAGAKVEAMEEHCLLSTACLAWFHVQTRAPYLGVALPTTHSGRGIPSQSYPTGVPTGQSNGGSSVFEVPSSQVTLVCVKWIKTNWWRPNGILWKLGWTKSH